MSGRERPIIFGGDSVRAILAGRKTQTRRAVKQQPSPTARFYRRDSMGAFGWTDNSWLHCPYGQPGDLLWVRETWAEAGNQPPIAYRADYDPQQDTSGWGWRSPLFLPRQHARLVLRVEDVSVERLQEIDAVDAMAEGIGHMHRYDEATRGLPADARERFAEEWDRINGRRRVASGAWQGLVNRKRTAISAAYSWAANPWVWVVMFAQADAPPLNIASEATQGAASEGESGG